MCDSGKGETFSERSKERRSARKISRCARNDSVGDGYPLYRIKCALGKCSSCITISRYARNDGMGGSKSPRNVGWRQAVLSVSSYRAQESQSSDKSNQ